MIRAELLTLEANLMHVLQQRVNLGGYGADAEIIKFLTACLLDATRQLIQHDKEIARLKRAPKKKKK